VVPSYEIHVSADQLINGTYNSLHHIVLYIPHAVHRCIAVLMECDSLLPSLFLLFEFTTLLHILALL